MTTSRATKQDSKVGTKPGALLLAWLFRRAEEKGISKQELASELGITYAYLYHLTSDKEDKKSCQRASDEFIEAATRFLELPKVAVLIAAEKVKRSDFVMEDGHVFEQELNRAIDYISGDAKYGMFVPVNIKQSPLAYKQLVVIMYEQATQKKLLTDTVSLESLFDSVDRFYSADER